MTSMCISKGHSHNLQFNFIAGAHMLGSRSGHKYITTNLVAREIKHFEILAELPFSSEWKRQSIVAKTPEGEIWLFIKGADATIIPMCNSTHSSTSISPQVVHDNTVRHLTEFASDGLRTLVLAAKQVTTTKLSLLYLCLSL